MQGWGNDYLPIYIYMNICMYIYIIYIIHEHTHKCTYIHVYRHIDIPMRTYISAATACQAYECARLQPQPGEEWIGH